MGAIFSVSVWDHRPSPDELLKSRLDRGWMPTASELQDGPAVLGHAACAVAKL